MFVKETDGFMNGVRHALNLPLSIKCAELTVLLDRGNFIELHSFFPVLIDNIFGPQGTLSWGLRTTTEQTGEDFRQLQFFLSPNGPLFKLIYSLVKEPGAKYEFPLQYLPTKVRQFLENSHNHSFYADSVYINPQTKQVVSLLLNPFDYYMFHFAYHLINPWHQRSTSNVSTWSTVYYVLCCDYILYFLPTSPGNLIFPTVYCPSKCPDYFAQQNQKSADETFDKKLDRHPRTEIWRSETVLTVFIDMWLHNDQISQRNNMSNTFNPSLRMNQLYYNELPSTEYMRILRVFIKHLHAFSASHKADDSHLGELKKIAIPMIQGKFYIFLRNLIHKWPLDGSFRLVLELWLTYIQPWRYPPNLHSKTSSDMQLQDEDLTSRRNVEVDQEYLKFIAENLLAYVVIFQQLLPRFTRVDLSSPKMSLMLYRITKVFDQPNLTNLLTEIESSVENDHSPTHHKYNSHWSNNLPPLSPTSNWSTNTDNHVTADSPKIRAFSPIVNSTAFLNQSLYTDRKWQAIVRQKIFELEGPNFCYKPLFTVPAASEICELICQIKKAIRMAQDLVREKQEEESKFYGGFWGFFRQLYLSPTTSDEFTLADRMKVPVYLEVSLQNLMDMFQVGEINLMEPEARHERSSMSSSGIDVSNDYTFLTPEKVRNRIKTIKYEGDPDLHPIRSNENTFLVRSLYQIATKMNQEYGPVFYRLYHDHSFYGRLARQFLCPPLTVYKYDKSIVGSPRVSSNLPPRISFRYLADYKFLTYLLFGAIFCYFFFGFHIFTYIFFILFLFLLYKCIKAIPSNNAPVTHNYPTQGFGNISFNDSF